MVWAFTAPVQADTFVLDKNFVLTGSVTVYLQYAAASGGPWSTAVTINAPDSAVIYWREFTAQTKQWWRLRITGLTAAPEIFNVWLGKRIDLTFGSYGDFDPKEEEVIGDAAEGASGGFQWTQRFRRRRLRADFQNLTDTQFALIEQWWTEAGRDGKNWWWLTYPTSEPTDPLYLNCQGAARKFAFNHAVRYGILEAVEVK